MFYRVVNTSYKDKEYLYVKLLESRREAGKVRHIQLVNLSSNIQMRPDKIKPLIEDLNKTLVFYKGITDSGLPWSKYLKAAYIMALENSFKVERRCGEQDFREILLRDSKKKYTGIYDETLFNELIFKKTSQWGDPGDLVCWIEKENALILDNRGFPLRLLPLKEKKVKETAELLLGLGIGDCRIKFFLGNSCELLYNTFHCMTRLEKKSNYTVRDVFLFRQLTDFSGDPASLIDKVLVMGTGEPVNDELLKLAMVSVIDIKSHCEFVGRRIESATGATDIPEKDLNGMYFISSLFKKIFDYLKNKHSI